MERRSRTTETTSRKILALFIDNHRLMTTVCDMKSELRKVCGEYETLMKSIDYSLLVPRVLTMYLIFENRKMIEKV